MNQDFVLHQIDAASLIWVAQQTGVLDILTIDRKDFSVYRLPTGKPLNLVL